MEFIMDPSDPSIYERSMLKNCLIIIRNYINCTNFFLNFGIKVNNELMLAIGDGGIEENQQTIYRKLQKELMNNGLIFNELDVEIYLDKNRVPHEDIKIYMPLTDKMIKITGKINFEDSNMEELKCEIKDINEHTYDEESNQAEVVEEERFRCKMRKKDKDFGREEHMEKVKAKSIFEKFGVTGDMGHCKIINAYNQMDIQLTDQMGNEIQSYELDKRLDVENKLLHIKFLAEGELMQGEGSIEFDYD